MTRARPPAVVAVLFALASGLAAPRPAAAAPHAVAWDQYSLMIDGQRIYVWSGEFHPFRLPSPSLWRDVLQKLKASGYNAVSLYFDWGYHSARRGVYDFTGVRDMDQVLALAQEVGLYVIARPGPYINAEADGGGFPGWLANVAGRARTRCRGLHGGNRRVAIADRRDPRPPPADQRCRHGHPVPDRERARVHRHQPAKLHEAPARQGACGWHHGADLPQRQGPQRPVGAGELQRVGHSARPGRSVRVRRLPRWHVPQRHHPGRPVGRPGLGPGRRRRHGRRDRIAEHAGLRRRVRRRLVRFLGRDRHVPVHVAARGARVRARVLRDQHRQPAHDPELLHDRRRHIVGLAAGAGGLHLLRLRRGDRRGAPAPRAKTPR